MHQLVNAALLITILLCFFMWLDQGSTEPLKLFEKAPLDHAIVHSFDNQAWDLKNYLDKPLILIFWATWCVPCLHELPQINELARKYGKEINFISVATDSPAKDVAEVVRKYNLQFFVARASDHFLKDWKVSQLPLIYAIKQSGIIQNVFVGQLDTTALEQTIQSLLNPKAN